MNLICLGNIETLLGSHVIKISMTCSVAIEISLSSPHNELKEWAAFRNENLRIDRAAKKIHHG